MKIRFDAESLKLISLFESETGAKVRDCITDDKVTFIVEENEMGKAIGKQGANIKKMEAKLKKRIKLVEYSSDISRFIRNLIQPVEVNDIKEENKIVTIHGKDTSSKAMIIGRERSNLNSIKEIVKRYFDVNEIKVI